MKIKKSTIVRAILLLLVIINFFLEKFGLDLIPTNESTVAMLVEEAIEIAVIVVSFWKNNSFSPKAIRADKFLQDLRDSE